MHCTHCSKACIVRGTNNGTLKLPPLVRALTSSCGFLTCGELNLVVSCESSYQLSRLGIPDLDSAICRGTGQPSTARRELHTDRAQIVTNEFMLQLVVGFVARCTIHAALCSKAVGRLRQIAVSRRGLVSTGQYRQ